MPDTAWAVAQVTPRLIPGHDFNPGFDVILSFRHVLNGSLALAFSTHT
jgi:hypothetical protein